MTMALRLIAGVAACVNTTEGTLATTTEPTTSAPARSGAMEMTCAEFVTLDQPARLAVVKEIVAKETAEFGPLGPESIEQMATAMCQFLPEQPVAQVLRG